MPGIDGAERGRAPENPRSSLVAQSGKFSSILAYLDHVSDDFSSHDSEQRGDNHGGIPCAFNELDVQKPSTKASSMSSSVHQTRRRQRQELRSQQEHRSSARSSELARVHGMPARLDNSMKDSVKGKTPSWAKCQDHEALSAPHDGGKREGVGFVQRGQPRAAEVKPDGDHRTQLNPCAAAARDSPRNRPHRGVVHSMYSAVAIRGDRPPSADDGDRIVNVGGSTSSHKERADNIQSAEGTQVSTTGRTVQQRRWVWDEWEDNNSSPPSSRPNTNGNNETNSSGKRSSARTVASSPSLPSSTGLHPRSALAPAGPANDHDWTWRSPSRRGKDHGDLDDNEDACPPAARQAYEDVQATARAMRASLKERRSEVCRRTAWNLHTPTYLQQIGCWCTVQSHDLLVAFFATLFYTMP